MLRAEASTASCPDCALCVGSPSFADEASDGGRRGRFDRRRRTGGIGRRAPRRRSMGASTALVTRDACGGMAAHDGPVPVRTLAHAARLIRDAGQLGRYGITGPAPELDYGRLLARVREVVGEVRTRATFDAEIKAAGVTVHERVGVARFTDPHTVETQGGLVIRAAKVVVCTGGTSRRLAIPGFELTATHSDAWSLTSVPPTMLVIGGGATGLQVASIFNAFGTRVQLYARRPHASCRPRTKRSRAPSPRPSARRVSRCTRRSERSNRSSRDRRESGWFSRRTGTRGSAEAALAVVGGRGMDGPGRRGRPGNRPASRRTPGVRARRRSAANHRAPRLRAAGDVTGRLMLVPQAVQDGFVAGDQRRRRNRR